MILSEEIRARLLEAVRLIGATRVFARCACSSAARENALAGGHVQQATVEALEKSLRDFESTNQKATGHVYFVQVGDAGPIKIGFSIDPVSRFSALQSGHSERLRLLKTLPGSIGFERELHRRFAEHRTNGEWFSPSVEIMAFLDLPAVSTPPLLTAMTARKEQLEAARRRLFPLWKAALEAAAGNVSAAAANFDPPMTRNKGNRLTRRFELVDYAKSLRLAATGRAMGRGSRKNEVQKK